VLRVAAGQSPVAPDAALSHAADMLRMTRGVPATDGEARALDAYLVTVCDHGLNASTFAARVVASTRAGLTSAVLAGISALKGPLHGGAPGPGDRDAGRHRHADNAEAWILEALARGDRLMGFGHRIYRVRDPRADALKAAIRQLAQTSTTVPGRLAFAEGVEQAALRILRDHKPDRPLDTNVEFYTAVLLEALGLPPKPASPACSPWAAPPAGSPTPASWCAAVGHGQAGASAVGLRGSEDEGGGLGLLPREAGEEKPRARVVLAGAVRPALLNSVHVHSDRPPPP
jgi:citrate synthase